jgi:hypothetical protein
MSKRYGWNWTVVVTTKAGEITKEGVTGTQAAIDKYADSKFTRDVQSVVILDNDGCEYSVAEWAS